MHRPHPAQLASDVLQNTCRTSAAGRRRPARQMRPSTRLLVVIVFAAAVVLYGGLKQHQYTGDDLQYLMVVDAAATGAVFYHPAGGRPFAAPGQSPAPEPRIQVNLRYPAEYPVSAMAVNALRHLGGLEVIDALLWFRALIGAIGVALFFLAIVRLDGSTSIALVSATGLAMSASYWTFATHLDYSINTAVMLCVVMLLLVAMETSNGSRAAGIALPVALAIATLFTVTAGLVAFATWVWLIRRPDRPGHRTISAMAFASIYAIVLAAALTPWLLAVRSWPSTVRGDYWRREFFASYPEYSVSWARDSFRTGLAMAKAIVGSPGGALSLASVWAESRAAARVALIVSYAAAALLVTLPIGYLIARGRGVTGSASLWRLWTAWLVGYAIVNWLWDPGYIKFWVVPMVAWWGVFAIALIHARATSRRYHLVLSAATVVVIAIGAINLCRQFGPESRPTSNPWRAVAARLGATPVTALFLSPAHPLDFHIAYFARRDIVSTGLVAYGHGGDWTAVKKIVASHVNAHRAAGGPVYFYGVDSLPAGQREAFLRLLPAGTRRIAWTLPQLNVYEIIR